MCPRDSAPLERVSLLLDPDSAREVAERALAETKRFLANSDDWVDNLEQSLRLLRLAIRVRDFEGGKSLVRLVLTRIERHTGDEVPGTLTYAGEALRGRRARADVRAYVVSRLVEAICSVLRPADFPRFAQRLWPSGSGNKGWPTPRQFNRYTRLLAASDLRTFDREDDRFGRNTYEDARADISVGRDDREPIGQVAQDQGICGLSAPMKTIHGEFRRLDCSCVPDRRRIQISRRGLSGTRSLH